MAITQQVDPISRSVIQHWLLATCEEMKATLIRTAHSTVIYEILDFSTGIFNRRGEVVAQNAGLAVFLGTLDLAVQATIEKFGVDGLQPGDVIISNDPYEGGGTHLSDVTLISPVFFQDDLVAFTATRAHWTEVGGKDPASFTPDSVDVFQEGLQFPVVKLTHGRSINRDLVDLIRANVRMPDMVIGDMFAQMAACRTGERRLVELLEKFGVASVEQTMAHILAAGEQSSRQAIAALPDGLYEGVDYLDDDGMGHGPIPIAVTIAISGSNMTMDLSKSAPQTVGPANTGWAGCLSGARTIMKALIAPMEPSNAGFYRPLTVIAPKGLVVNAVKPAPVSMYHECVARIMDVVWQVLAPLAPDRLPAGHYSSCCATGVWGNLPETSKFTLMLEPQGGGWGASPTADGESALICLFDGDTYNIPVEVAEARYPYRVEQYSLRTDSGGPGRFRGGLGIVRDYRMTGENMGGLVMFERYRYPPFGLKGGKPGATNKPTIFRVNGQVESLGKGKLFFAKGDLLRLETGGGGGYGSAFKRDPVRVAEDVLDGYVSREAAEREYGVVLKSGSYEVDFERTGRLRRNPEGLGPEALPDECPEIS